MSDASSAVTYTSVYNDSEPWRYYGEESAKTRSLGVFVYGYDRLPMQQVALPSLDYVPGPKHPPSLDYVPVPFDAEAPLEDQPLPTDASPTVASPGYVADSDPDEDPKEDLEDDHADYHADGGDGDDEPSDDNDDDDTDDDEEEPFEDEEGDEEEEEHLALNDSFVVPIVDLVSPVGDTEAFETDEAQKTVRLEPPMSASIEAHIARHVALLLPPLPVSSLQLPLPSPLTTSPTNTRAALGYRVAEIRMRALLTSTSHRTDIPEADVPPQKKACLTTPTSGFEVGESSTVDAARQPRPTLESNLRRHGVHQTGYGITDTWDEIIDTLMEIALTTMEGVDQRVTELDTTIR
uniref:Uncharacterized protein n=1 Tax=Tanacetum cinerariifolium TaxID=118510 RepID=A0A699GPC1_TANCI|nr:hypothetical protein [Tanacetum cinerariifolium]